MTDIARYHSKAEWESRNPKLRNGEPGFEEDTGKLKIGDGVKRWNELPYQDVAPYTLPIVESSFGKPVDPAPVIAASHDTDVERETFVPARLSDAALRAALVFKGELVYNVRDYGAKGDGVADDTSAINAAIAAMPSVDVFGAVTRVLYFPAGRYITSGGHIFAKRINVRGDGRYITSIYAKGGSTADLLTFNAAHSGIAYLTVDGARSGTTTTGDAVVLNAAYDFVDQATIANAPGNGISIGKASPAVACMIANVYVLNCKGYGIRVFAGTNTDGIFSDLDIGPSGLSGFRIDAPAQNLTNVHAWGSGVESATDRSGFYVTTDACHFANCEAETNRAHGWFFEGATRGNVLTGCYSWGNNANGIYVYQGVSGVISGCAIYNNGVGNTTSSTATNFAGILLDAATNWAVSGCNIYDTAGAIPAGSYASVPTYPFAGRGAIRTQTNAYAETGASNYHCLAGNMMRAEQTYTGIAVVVVGNDEIWGENQLGNNPASTLTAAATVYPRPQSRLQKVTGANTITTVYAYAAGRQITLLFVDAIPGAIAHGTGNIRLAGGANWTPTQNDTLTLICDGVNWYETARTVI